MSSVFSRKHSDQPSEHARRSYTDHSDSHDPPPLKTPYLSSRNPAAASATPKTIKKNCIGRHRNTSSTPTSTRSMPVSCRAVQYRALMRIPSCPHIMRRRIPAFAVFSFFLLTANYAFSRWTCPSAIQDAWKTLLFNKSTGIPLESCYYVLNYTIFLYIYKRTYKSYPAQYHKKKASLQALAFLFSAGFTPRKGQWITPFLSVVPRDYKSVRSDLFFHNFQWICWKRILPPV